MRRTIPAWPVALGVTLVLLFVTSWFGYLTAFVDERWGPFIPAAAFLSIIAMSVTPAIAGAGARITLPRRKPRGWRKLRREAEERAYIRDLERELGL